MTDSLSTNVWVSRLAKLCVALTLILILAGAVVTTAGAGMVSPNAPHVGGKLLFPSDMWTSWAGFFEHSHRHIAMLTGLCIGILCTILWRNWVAFFVAVALMGLPYLFRGKLDAAMIAHLRIWPAMVVFIVLVLAGAKRRKETPTAVQWLALTAFIAACIQAVFGALRVEIETSGNLELATNTRIVHGIFAQAVLVVLVILAARLSPVWRELRTLPESDYAPKFRSMAIGLLGMYFVQLALAAYLRHRGLGLVIPTWPEAQTTGSWLPAAWTHVIGIHFLHSRVMPFLIAGHAFSLAGVLARRAPTPRLKRLGWLLLGLVILQITLGALVIWKGRHAHITNTHVMTGAFICAATALLLARTRALLPVRA